MAYERLAYRNRGEVAPRVQCDDPSGACAENRRVEFQIVQRFEAGPYPTYPREQRLPWSGEVVPVVTPPVPEPDGGPLDEPDDLDEFGHIDELEIGD